jgi:hypothetical protein
MKIFLLCLTLVSCATIKKPTRRPPASSVAVQSTKPATVITAIEPELAEAVLSAAAFIRIQKLTGFSEEQRIRFERIVEKANRVASLSSFRNKVESWRFNGENAYHFTEDTPAQVYAKITGKSWELEYELKKRAIPTKTIGYTLPSVTWIALYSDQYRKLSDCKVVGNIYHEYGGHKLGRYGHEQKHNSKRPYSVPYALGTIAEELCKTL